MNCPDCRFPSHPDPDPANRIAGVFYCSRCADDFYVWPGLGAAIRSELRWWWSAQWWRAVLVEVRDSGLIGAFGFALSEWSMDHAHPGRTFALGCDLMNHPRAVARRRRVGRKD